MRDADLGGCGRRRPMRKSHRLSQGCVCVCRGRGGVSLLRKMEGPRPRQSLGFSISAGKGRGHAPGSFLGTRVVSIATSPPCPLPPVISGKNGCGPKHPTNPFAPSSHSPAWEATGHEAERVSDCALSPPPPECRRCPLVGSLVECGPPQASWGVGTPQSVPPQRSRRPPIPAPRLGGRFLARGPAPGGGRAGSRPFQACPRGCDSSSLTPASPRSNKGLENEGRKIGGGAGTLVKHPHR